MIDRVKRIGSPILTSGRARGQTSARRNSLLGGAALGIVFLAIGVPGTAQAACLTTGTILTCNGELGNGVDATNPIELLQISGVTANIAPSGGVNGVNFVSSDTIAIVSDTGIYDIVVDDADGIFADTWNGSITIDHDGDILSTGGYGIRTISLAPKQSNVADPTGTNSRLASGAQHIL